MSADTIFAGDGYCLVGPYGTTLPEDIDDMETVAAALKNLGEVSEDGLEEAFSVDKSTLKNWKGAVVRMLGSSTEITFKLTFLERNKEVLELFYGSVVTSAGAAGSKIVLGQPSDEPRAMVIPMEDPGTGALEVVVAPNVVVSDRGSRTVKPDEAGAYEITFTALGDTSLDGASAYKLYDVDLTP
jgi:hypothetical protein